MVKQRKGKTREITRRGVWNAGIHNTGKTQEVTLFFCFSSLAVSVFVNPLVWTGCFVFREMNGGRKLFFVLLLKFPSFQTTFVETFPKKWIPMNFL